MRPPGLECAGASNEALIAASQAGDEDAFAELYRRYAFDVRRWCARRVRDPARDEDLMQETFLRAFAGIATFKLGNPFWPWLVAVARSVCADELRSRPVGRIISLDDERERKARERTVDNSEEKEVVDLRLTLAAALSSLTPQDRRFIWLRAVEERSYEEIARMHASTVDTVRNRTWRARGWARSVLRDMRSLWPLPWIGSWVGDRVRRLRVRLSEILQRFGGPGEGMLLQQAVVALVTVAVLPGWLGRSHEWDGSPPPKTLGWSVGGRPAPESRLMSESRPPGQGGAQPRPVHPTFEDGSGVLQAAVRTKTREGGAAPGSARLRVEVRGPDGRVLYWRELNYECTPSTLRLPNDGPVRTYC